jgi:hypothetical protein
VYRPSLIDSEDYLPLIVQWASDGGSGSEALQHYYQESRDLIEQVLLERGAILFRGFGIDQQEVFQRTVGSLPGQMLNYVDGNSPRKKLASGVYTSTEYPPELFISMHNELSYSEKWPSRLFFCCVTAPQEGGETPLADSRSILRSLGPRLAGEFAEKGVRYIRNLHGGRGYGPSWQATFETQDPAMVESLCNEGKTHFEWRPDGGIRLWNVRPGVAPHPRTGEMVWFNQADQFHPSTHPAQIYQALLTLYKGREDQFPQNATFGDGTPIGVELLAEVRSTIQKEIRSFAWQQGDLLMVDNMLVCHGRNPFKGARKILVSMTDG